MESLTKTRSLKGRNLNSDFSHNKEQCRTVVLIDNYETVSDPLVGVLGDAHEEVSNTMAFNSSPSR